MEHFELVEHIEKFKFGHVVVSSGLLVEQTGESLFVLSLESGSAILHRLSITDNL